MSLISMFAPIMSLTSIFVPIGIAAVIWHVATTILIYEALRKRGVKVSFLFLKLFAPMYASQYKEITLKESGKVGSLFFHWIISINIAFVSAILLLIERFS